MRIAQHRSKSAIQASLIATQSVGSHLRSDPAIAACAAGNAVAFMGPMTFSSPADRTTVTVGTALKVGAILKNDCGSPLTAVGGAAALALFDAGDSPLTLTDTGAGIWVPANAGSVTFTVSAGTLRMPLLARMPVRSMPRCRRN